MDDRDAPYDKSNDKSNGKSAARSAALKALYERLPYPPRDPADEHQRLVRTSLDHVEKISHSCFSGALRLDDRLRFLVAGGGTGDAVVYLAEQTRDTGVRIDYLDVSEQSLEIARARIEARGFTHVEFRCGSVLDAASLYSEPFDYINCSGVLHHLPDPDAGLAALRDVLKPEGAIGIMVYARYGRLAIYPVQDLLRRIGGDLDLQQQLDIARRVLARLPETHWFNRSKDLHRDHVDLGDAGLADLLLNPSDRAYSVPELYEWLDGAGLSLVRWESHRMHYQAERYTDDPTILQALEDKPTREREAIAELMSSTMIKHTFYAAKQAPAPSELRGSCIPVVAQGIDRRALIERMARTTTGQQIEITTHDARLNLPVNPISVGFFQQLGSDRTLEQIDAAMRQAPELSTLPPKWVQGQLLDLCRLLLSTDMLLLLQTPLRGRGPSE